MASSATERLERALGDLIHRADGVDGDDAGAVALVPIEDRRGLRLVDRQPIPYRRRLVVFSAHERAAALVAFPTRLAPGVGRLAVLAHRARAEPAHDLVVIDVEVEHGVELAVRRLQHALESF